ncbi:hypothetical protein J6590_080388 [Homalodisca vitripennis]|nr:hypothetical protein J6590_080388 [Homalodisca vitripennis]
MNLSYCAVQSQQLENLNTLVVSSHHPTERREAIIGCTKVGEREEEFVANDEIVYTKR